MCKVLIICGLAIFTMCGCSNVEVYTFKKERVDQQVAGNRGYMLGEEKAAPSNLGKSKRTLIGIDIDMGDLGSGSSTDTEDSNIK